MNLDLASALGDLVEERVRKVLREQAGTQTQTGEYLTYSEAAELAHVSIATVKRWVRDGRLRAFGEGRVRRVRSSDVRLCVEGRARPVVKPTDKVRSILAGLGRNP